MSLLAAVRTLAGRQHLAHASRVWRTAPSASVTINKTSLDEQQQFWEKNEARLKRPLSPHLSIYAPQVTSMLSLVHRASGLVMALGLYGISYAVVAVPYDFPAVVEMIRGLSLPGALVYSAKTTLAFLLVYHYINGMRHMAWDLTYGFGLKELYKSGFFVLGLSLLVSAGIAAL